MEIIVYEDHVSCLFADIRPIFAHRDSDVCTFQSDAIVDTISGHTDNISSMLQSLDNRKLVLWSDAIKNAHVVDDFLKLHLVHLVDVMTADGLLVNRIKSDELSCKRKLLITK